MSVRSAWFVCLVFIVGGVCARAAVIRVPADSATIQGAVDAARDGDEIIVTTGTYHENVRMMDKELNLHSVDPERWDVVEATIIDGGHKGPVISVGGTTYPYMRISGFLIRNGVGGVIGVDESVNNAYLVRNHITQNDATTSAPGAIVSINGSIERNRIDYNQGHGIYQSWAHKLRNNIIARNQGAGLYRCGLAINNTIVFNAGPGCQYPYLNYNTIFWGNQEPQISGGSSYFNYCCIQNWTPAWDAVGIIAFDPRFADPDHDDFWLLSDSPCLDAGALNPDVPPVDFDNQLRPLIHASSPGSGGSNIDIGAYEQYGMLALNHAPDRPTITSPSNGWVADSDWNTLAMTSFSDPDLLDSYNYSAHFQISQKSNFSSLAFDKLSEYGYRSISLHFKNLKNPGTYYVRGRYLDGRGLASEWSSIISFVMPVIYAPNRPTNLTPANGAVLKNPSPVLTASPFSDKTLGSIESKIELQVSKDIDFLNIIGNQLNYTANTFQLSGGMVDFFITYYWRVRYTNSWGLQSDWSMPTSFRMADPIHLSHVPQDFPTIQQAIDLADPAGCEIIVAPGTYREYLNSKGKTLNLHSTNPDDWNVVRATIITPEDPTTDYEDNRAPLMTLQGTEGPNLRIAGFTFLNGSINWDGGAAISGKKSLGLIEKNCFEYNASNDPFFTDLFGNGSAESSGGAIYQFNGTIRKNIFHRNFATYGGALADCDGPIENNIFIENLANDVLHTDGSIIGHPMPWHTTVVAYGAGDELAGCNGPIVNNTFLSCYNKSLLAGCRGLIANNLFDTNPNDHAPFFANCSMPQYCAIASANNYTTPSLNCIFGDLGRSDSLTTYGLRMDSPCIDAGLRVEGVVDDFYGVQRGLKAGAAGRGDGSGYDIGAVEMLPPAAAVWVETGGCAAFAPGQTLTVKWRMPLPDGEAVRFKLYRDGVYQTMAGPFGAVGGRQSATFALPKNLMFGDHYVILGASATSSTLTGWTGEFAVQGPRTDVKGWRRYR